MKIILPATLAVCGILGGTIAEAAPGSDELTIWMKWDKNYVGMARIGEKFTAQTGIKVKVEHLEDLFERFRKEVSENKGPDIVLWAHDRIGEWAAAGLLTPLELSDETKIRFIDFTWNTMAYGDQIYGYPLSVEALGLICNKDLVRKVPTKFEEFIKLDNKLKSKGTRALLWDYNQVYFSWPLLSAQGGYSYQKINGIYDTDHPGINNEGMRKGFEFIRKLLEDGHVQRGADYNMPQQQFMEGKLACTLNGPWAWAEYEQAGVNFEVYPLPSLGGQRGRAFVGIQGLVISSASNLKDQARDFLENYLLTDEGLEDFSRDKDFGLAALKSFENIQEKNLNQRALVTMDGASFGEIMPSIPEMDLFWKVMDTALKDVVSGKKSSAEALADAEKQLTVAATR